MCGGIFSSPSSPSPPPPVEPIPVPRQPKLVDEGVRKARDDEKSRAALAANRGGTFLTGSGGLGTSANTSKKTLLG